MIWPWLKTVLEYHFGVGELITGLGCSLGVQGFSGEVLTRDPAEKNVVFAGSKQVLGLWSMIWPWLKTVLGYHFGVGEFTTHLSL